MGITTTPPTPVMPSAQRQRPFPKFALLRHVVGHDFRRLWPHVLLCVVAAALGYGVGTHPSRAGAVHFWESLVVQLSVVPYWALLGSLFPTIVQSDSPIGSSGFLMTRPISSRFLLMAKFIEAGVLFVVVPLTIHATFLTCQGFTGAQIVEGAISFSSGMLWALVFGVFFASVTRDLFQFWLLVVGLFVALTVGSAWIPSSPVTVARELQQSRGQVQYSITAIGLLAGTFWQHRHRKPIRALVVAGLGVFAASQLISYWPWTIPWVRDVRPPTEVLSWSHAPVKGLLFSTDYLNNTRLLFTSEVAVPIGEAVHLDEVDGKVEWSSQTERLETDVIELDPTDIGSGSAVQALLGKDFRVVGSSDTLDRRVNIILGPQPKDSRTASSFHGNVRGNRLAFSFLGTMPLRPWASISKDGRKVVLQEVYGPDEKMKLTIWCRRPAPATGSRSSDLRFVLVNRSRREAHILNGLVLRNSSAALIPGIEVDSVVWVSGEGDENNHAEFLSPEWLGGAQLVVFVAQPSNPVVLDLSCAVPKDYFPQYRSPSQRENARKELENEMRSRIRSPDSSTRTDIADPTRPTP